MKRIFKYPLAMKDEQTIDILSPAQLLSVMEQDNRLVLYALIHDGPGWGEKVKVFIRGTGHPMNKGGACFLGTVQATTGLVWHVFYSK